MKTGPALNKAQRHKDVSCA